MASHYNFEPLFCLPARGNKKPHVENRVKWLKQEWATPVPKVRDLAELNVLLAEKSRQDRQRTLTGQSATINVRLDEDRAGAQPLPQRAFEACLSRAVKVDKYQTARFDNVCYSVPRRYAYQTVTVKAFVDRIHGPGQVGVDSGCRILMSLQESHFLHGGPVHVCCPSAGFA